MTDERTANRCTSATTRRRFLGAAGTAGLSAIAGCMGVEDLPIVGGPRVPDSYRAIAQATAASIERELYATPTSQDRENVRYKRLLNGREIDPKAVPVEDSGGDGEGGNGGGEGGHPFRFEATLRTSEREEYRVLEDEPRVREDIRRIFTEVTYAAVEPYANGRVVVDGEGNDQETVSPEEITAYAEDIRGLTLRIRDTEDGRATVTIPRVATAPGSGTGLDLTTIAERASRGVPEPEIEEGYVYPGMSAAVQYSFGEP